ncbi:MAG: hypothetical protein FIB06_05295 [Betaproteobacteria bacterium]|nr:hypothetical protein [Betaproteobacteria bacterium]
MSFVVATASMRYTPAELAAAARNAAGSGLRRAGDLTRLALLVALAALPEARRRQPTALFWQTTSGPRRETAHLLASMGSGDGEPLPYDFLATQPALAAVQIQPWLPGLAAASATPLDRTGEACWALLLADALAWTATRPGSQVLCAHLDAWGEHAEAHALLIAADPGEAPLARIAPVAASTLPLIADIPELPAILPAQVAAGNGCALAAPAGLTLALEFVRP